MYKNLFTLFLTDLWALHASITQREQEPQMSEYSKIFEPVKDGVSDIGCRMTHRAWVALWAERICQTLHAWEIVDRITAKVRVHSLI